LRLRTEEEEVHVRRVAAFAMLFMSSIVGAAQFNFDGAKATALNESPNIELSDFSFSNEWNDRRRDVSFHTNLGWKNTGQVPVIAFEVILVKYDAFNRHISTRRWTITGHNSADWTALKPGEESRDGTIGLAGTEDVYTEFAYVAAVRLGDGTVWHADIGKIQAKIRAALPGLRELGDIEGKHEEAPKAK
jgi:hypothetical protein